MLREILPGIWLDDITTDFASVRNLNYAFIPGKNGGRSLLVDAGLSDSVDTVSRRQLLRDLRELHIAPEDLDCILTHSHRDHVGQARLLNDLGARVFINPTDMRFSENEMHREILHPDRRKDFFRYIGLELSSDDTYQLFWKAADEFCAGLQGIWDFKWDPLPPGETVEYGDYRLETVPLPGHTSGHMGLWEKEKKILFSADVLIKGVVPIVSNPGNYPNALDDYLNSLRAVKHRYADCLFIPGHGKPFRNPQDLADSTVENYLDKLSIMYDILRRTEGPLSIRGVAVRAYGRYGKHLTDAQRRSCILIWFKTCACLNYMKARDLVEESVEDGVSMWSAKKNPAG